MSPARTTGPVEILLVEDNPGDANLTREGLLEGMPSGHLSVVETGEEALDYLRRQGPYTAAQRPDMILLDLNLPGMSGHEVLEQVKTDDRLKQIPVVVLTTSEAETDVLQSYHLQANCYITKPATFTAFVEAVKALELFWFEITTLPPRREP